MKLQKWRCGACGFEWFESLDCSRSEHNINHGCPQGCDDAGKVVGKMEATDNKRQWICWILSKEDIDLAANRIGVKTNKFTEDDYEDIARDFIKGSEWANKDWEQILTDAIENSMS